MDVVRKVAPPKVYLIGDGPRPHVDGERAQVRRTREFVENEIDWDCTIRKRYADENMGGPRRFPTGLDWVFEQEDRAIILEDDLLPTVDFFRYCEVLLNRYEDDPEVMAVCGNNAGVSPDTDYSYFFSNIFRTLGWATWASAWECYDDSLDRWPEMRANGILQDRFVTEQTVESYTHLFDVAADDDIDIKPWDAVWGYSILANDGFVALPADNLSKHTGFGEDSMHNEVYPYFQQFLYPDLHSMSFPMRNPPTKTVNTEFERGYLSYKQGSLQWALSWADRAVHVYKNEGVVPMVKKGSRRVLESLQS
ncbi:hypothetical protein [Haloarcula marina]|uniref:hypothetical protein n=1 Tax=Haloarcula marina TaxID=2961574 RepID=UPI0020B7C083|nr:hypothetical protein [Halomicroarcula marina]